MSSLKQLARIVDDRRNWPTFVLAGALVFIGLLILDALDVRNGFTVILLVVAGAFAADRLRPFETGGA